MEIQQAKVGDVNVYRVSGRIDSDTADTLWQTASQALEEGTKKIIVNCEELDYISSAGLRTLLIIAKHVRPQNGIVALCNLTSQIKSVMDIAGISTCIKIYGNLEDALRHCEIV